MVNTYLSSVHIDNHALKALVRIDAKHDRNVLILDFHDSNQIACVALQELDHDVFHICPENLHGHRVPVRTHEGLYSFFASLDVMQPHHDVIDTATDT